MIIKFIQGPPYFYICFFCRHRFHTSRRFFVSCPRCKSFIVMKDPTVLK